MKTARAPALAAHAAARDEWRRRERQRDLAALLGLGLAVLLVLRLVPA